MPHALNICWILFDLQWLFKQTDQMSNTIIIILSSKIKI